MMIHTGASRMVPMFSLPVASLKARLERSSEWDQRRERTQGESPHREVSDIWVRYGRELKDGPHKSVWYPAAESLGIVPLIYEIADRFKASIGGVLITKIPPGKQVYPHIDQGWHAREYEKLAVSVSANHEQSFNFEGEQMLSEDGDCFTFDNAYSHWVKNDSKIDRMTLIVCFKRGA